MKRISMVSALAVLAVAWWLAIYLPGAGAGFLKDDFSWILQSRVRSVSELVALFSRNNGFYRPVVALSFTADHALFGLNSLPFGWTNVLLAMLAALSVARLAVSLRLPPVAAVVAASVWALNPHGINMAILWTSGRTALLLTLFATLAATSWAKGHPVRTAIWTLLALLSKEEAVVLPFVFLVWSFVRWRFDAGAGDRKSGRPFWPVAASLAVLAVYFVLRVHSGAMTPANAPGYYRLSFGWRVLVVNGLEYLDRGATFAILIALVAVLVTRRRPTLDSNSRRVAAMGLIWFLAGYALTVWLPVRSSLYACFPSVGAALVAGAVVAALVPSGATIRLVPTLAVVCLLAIASTPVYWSRNYRWVGAGRVSTSVVAALPGVVANQPSGTTLVFRDTDNPRENLKAAFGTALPDAIALATGRQGVGVWVEPPPGDWALAGWRQPLPGDKAASFVFDGRGLRPAS